MKTTRVDMHCHTPGSDGRGSPEEYVRAAKHANLDALIITDHHKTITPEGQAVVAALNAAGIMSFAGCEYSTAEGHLLVIGPDVEKDLGLGKDIKYPPMQEVIDRTIEAGGVAIPAHPYKGYRASLRDGVYFLENIPAIEVFNGQNQAREPETDVPSEHARQLMGLRGLGNSDAHFASDVGMCWTEHAGEIDTKEALIESLLWGDYRACRDERRLDRTRKARAQKAATWERARQERIQSVDSRSVFWESVSDGGKSYTDSSDESSEFARVQALLAQYG